jgi:hypothetical protein
MKLDKWSRTPRPHEESNDLSSRITVHTNLRINRDEHQRRKQSDQNCANHFIVVSTLIISNLNSPFSKKGLIIKFPISTHHLEYLLSL